MKKKQAIKLLREIFPTIIKEAYQASKIGEPFTDHECNNCEDCQWYNWGLSILQRLDEGEFDEIIN
jgi:hypothetical protein